MSVAASFACTIETRECLLDLMFIGAEAYVYTAGRGQLQSGSLLEILAAVQPCRDKPFAALGEAVLARRQALSGCICVLLGWDEARREFVHKLRSHGVALRVIVVTEAPVDGRPAWLLVVEPGQGAGRPGAAVNTLPLLLAAACALWGAQTGNGSSQPRPRLPRGAPRAAAALEHRAGPFQPPVRFLQRAGRGGCGLPLLHVRQPARAARCCSSGCRVLLLPLALAQAWSNLSRIDISAFVWTLRKDPERTRYTLNLGYPCFAVWVLAASAANASGPGFYAGLVALAAWALWAARPRRFPLAAWLAPLVLAAGAGYGVHQGLQRAQAWLEEAALEWLDASGSRTDPYRSRTDLGHIGDAQAGRRIVLRVRTEGAIHQPLLLHRASYDGYFGTTWSARDAPLEARLPDGPSRWVLGKSASPAVRVEVFDYSPRGNPVLSLPRGTVEVRGLEALSLKRNGLGTVQAESPPGFLYLCSVGGSRSRDRRRPARA